MNRNVVLACSGVIVIAVALSILWNQTAISALTISLSGVTAVSCLFLAHHIIALRGSRAHSDALQSESLSLAEKQVEDESRKLRLEKVCNELVRKNGDLEIENDELKLSLKNWERLALTDAMTDIPNHRAFRERITLETARAERYGYPLILLLIDVDNFKNYNDSFGHPAGDSLLKRLAETLSENIREGDFISRYGGEEFTAILPQTDIQNGRSVAERLRTAVESFEFDHSSITISIGAAEYGLDAIDAANLTNQADRALLVSKRLGKNRLTFFREMESPNILREYDFVR